MSSDPAAVTVTLLSLLAIDFGSMQTMWCQMLLLQLLRPKLLLQCPFARALVAPSGLLPRHDLKHTDAGFGT